MIYKVRKFSAFILRWGAATIGIVFTFLIGRLLIAACLGVIGLEWSAASLDIINKFQQNLLGILVWNITLMFFAAVVNIFCQFIALGKN